MNKKKNFFQRIFNKVSNKSVAFFSSPLGRISGMEDLYDSQNLKTFKDSLYLFIGVSMIRETVSSIPLEMYKIINKEGDSEQVYDDPYLDLFERPNYRQTQKEFWKLSIAYYLLAGEAFWYLEREGRGEQPTAMVNMRPDNVEVLLSQDKKQIVGYEFNQSNGEIIKIAPDDVLHIKNIDPTNPTRGVGVVRPATQRIITEKEASKHQADTFKNQGRPDIAVFVDADLTDEDAQDARERWQKIYGKDNGSQAGFFGQNVKDLKLLSVSPKEMDFMSTMNFLRDDILASLHIPKAMITSDDVNLANAQTARIMYIKEACLPVLDTFIDIINNKLLGSMNEDKFIIYESPVNEDREMLLREAVELKKAEIITINEARGLMNYEAVDDGDIREAGSGLGAFQLSLKTARIKKFALRQLKKRPVLVKRFKAISDVTDMLNIKKSVRRGRNSVFNTPDMKESYIKAFNSNIDKKSELFKDHIDVYNNQLLQRITKYMEDFGLSPNNIFDAGIEIVEAKKIFVPLMIKMFERIGQETMDSVSRGFDTKASESFYSSEVLRQHLELRAEFFITSMLDTDFKQLKEIISSGIENGQGVDVIGRSIRQYFDNMSVSRAKTIARTETGRLVSQATNEAYQQSEVVTGKEWLTAGDTKVRPEHQLNNQKIVATGDTFPNGEKYPGELSINCRCALAPAV